MKRKGLELNGMRKCAVILSILGAESSAGVLNHFSEEQIEALSLELARLEKVDSGTREKIIEEFHEMARDQEFIAEGGVDKAKQLLERALGPERAKDISDRIESAMEVMPFGFLKRADPQQILTFIQDEHPQTIALILAYLPVHQAAIILSKITPELRSEVAERIAVMDQTPPEVVRRVEQVLEKKVSNIIDHELTKAGGPKALVDLLNRVDRPTERLILEGLTESNSELADQVKNMMFVFEDITQLDDRDIQGILKEVETRDLATALKGASDQVQQKIFENMSERAREMLKEDIEFMGPVKMSVVEHAQQKVVGIIRSLEEAGDITIGRGEDEVLV